MLIVDDDAPVVTFLADIGESCGYEIMSANTGDGLLDRVLETGPDVIVLDLVMPDFDGIEVLREFSTHDIQSRILLISG